MKCKEVTVVAEGELRRASVTEIIIRIFQKTHLNAVSRAASTCTHAPPPLQKLHDFVLYQIEGLMATGLRSSLNRHWLKQALVRAPPDLLGAYAAL